MQRDRGVGFASRRQWKQLVVLDVVADVALFVLGIDAERVGWNPHLQEMYRLLVARVLLRVADARSRAHPLRDVARDDAFVAGAVAVRECAVEHPGDDLHIAVRVRCEPAARGDDVVVQDEQQPVVRVVRVVMLTEAETVPRVEPRDLGVESRLGSTDVDPAHQKRTP